MLLDLNRGWRVWPQPAKLPYDLRFPSWTGCCLNHHTLSVGLHYNIHYQMKVEYTKLGLSRFLKPQVNCTSKWPRSHGSYFCYIISLSPLSTCTYVLIGNSSWPIDWGRKTWAIFRDGSTWYAANTQSTLLHLIVSLWGGHKGKLWSYIFSVGMIPIRYDYLPCLEGEIARVTSTVS